MGCFMFRKGFESKKPCWCTLRVPHWAPVCCMLVLLSAEQQTAEQVLATYAFMLFAFFWTGFSQAFLQCVQKSGRLEYGMCFCYLYFPPGFVLIKPLLCVPVPANTTYHSTSWGSRVQWVSKNALGRKQEKIPRSEGLHFLWIQL